MPAVNHVAVRNRSNRAYFIGDVEVLPGASARVDGDNEFLATLVGRGDFIKYEAPTEDSAKSEPPAKGTNVNKDTRRASARPTEEDAD